MYFPRVSYFIFFHCRIIVSSVNEKDVYTLDFPNVITSLNWPIETMNIGSDDINGRHNDKVTGFGVRGKSSGAKAYFASLRASEHWRD